MSVKLVLESGAVFEGDRFGSEAPRVGEVVFNTSSTGYQEILTDPSYSFQIVLMTSPHVGNYGLSEEGLQSSAPQVAGFVIREMSESHHRESGMNLDQYLREAGIPGIMGIDTRALTRLIRDGGAVRGVIVDSSESTEEALDRIRKAPSMTGRDLVAEVSSKSRRTVPFSGEGETPARIAVYDYGIKNRIVDQLARRAEVVIHPADTDASEILEGGFDGVLLSNGPGDPEPVTYAQQNIRNLIGRIPVMGVCLGHQLLGLALGGRTYKLKFGHHGGNHPVQDLRTGRVEITAQNHGFAVDPESLPPGVEPTHINLNDQTLEGFRHTSEPVIAIQFHPEAAPGPSDSVHLFGELFRMIEEHSGSRTAGR